MSRQTEDSFFGAPQTLDGVWSGSETRCFPRTGAEGTRRPGSREFTSSGRGLLPRFRWEPTMAGVGKSLATRQDLLIRKAAEMPFRLLDGWTVTDRKPVAPFTAGA